MKTRLAALTSSLFLLLFTTSAGIAGGGMATRLSLAEAKHVAGLLSNEKNYEGELFVPLAVQNDRDFYAFEIIQNSSDAANLQMIGLNVNKVTGDVWFVIGSECSVHTSEALRDYQLSIQRRLGQRSFKKFHSLKPFECGAK
jgi:hypothetical protein